MNILNKFFGLTNTVSRKDNSPIIQTKSNDIINSLPWDNPLVWDDWFEILAYYALNYYRKCSPLFTAVELIADEFAGIKPAVYDVKADKYIDHEILDLLNHPFGDMTWTEFAKEFATYYLVTGNNYMVATGREGTVPLELINMYPASINILPSTIDGYAGTYLVTTPYYSESFYRDESTGYFRFKNFAKTRELWQVKGFNPRNRAGIGNYGMSKLTPIYYELEQHLNTSIHNLALLKNGGRLSMVFSSEKPLSTDQFQRIKKQIQNYIGSRNAGKTYLLDGVTPKEMGLTNKDMDFAGLKKEVKEQIYNTLKIPLALMSIERSTMNNMDRSMLALYDLAVTPLTNRLYEELTLFLMPRYKNSENLILKFRQDQIPALQDREFSNVQKKQMLGIYTVNELRSMLGEDPTEGGDVVLTPTTNAPLTIVGNDDPPEPQPGLGVNTDDEDETADKPIKPGGDLSDDEDDESAQELDEEDSEASKSFIRELNRLRFYDGQKIFKKPTNKVKGKKVK
jgi:HK97 family phage portal protein